MTTPDDEKLFEMVRGRYFRRDGTPYKDVMEWATDFESAPDRQVAQTTLWWGGQVSTVWLGLNHNYFDDGPPLIFETMVFPRNSLGNLDMQRYSTEAEALAGHIEMCKAWKYPFWKLFLKFCNELTWKVDSILTRIRR